MSEPFVGETKVREVIFSHIRRSIPALATRPINPDATIDQLGGHSLMVAGIVTGAMRELRIDVPVEQLASVRTTTQLVDVFMRYVKR